MNSPQPQPNPSENAPRARRKPLLRAVAGVFVLAGIAYGIYWAAYARFEVETDDAYVAGDVVQITPQTAGTVLAVNADDTDFVHAGAPLVKLNEADARVALDQAEAQLAQTVRQVRTLFAGSDALAATVDQRRSDVTKAQQDLKRRQALAGTGAVAGEELEHARRALAAAQAALDAARQQLASNQALIDNTTVAGHPNVRQAAARVRAAYLDLERTTVPAPVEGVVARRSVQVGQRVSPGTPLMAVVPLDQVWVDANFKEGQLEHMRIGQPVHLNADLYGTDVTYHGTIEGVSAGTGAAFSLLPAQNASGNWIKVVQRVPVRIRLDAEELKAHPLRIGLSMMVKVDVRDGGGESLAGTPPAGTQAGRNTSRTQVFADEAQGANALVEQIITANLAGALDRAVGNTQVPIARLIDAHRQAAR